MYEEFMKSVTIFSTIEQYELMKIMDAVKPVEYIGGTEIIKEVNREDAKRYREMKGISSSY